MRRGAIIFLRLAVGHREQPVRLLTLAATLALMLLTMIAVVLAVTGEVGRALALLAVAGLIALALVVATLLDRRGQPSDSRLR